MSLNTRQNETVTFRIESSLKADLSQLADEQQQSLGAFIRELALQRIKRAQRERFEVEAAQQSRAAAAAARDPSTDDYAVMQELDRMLEDFDDEWI